jgi:hypothetical protein
VEAEGERAQRYVLAAQANSVAVWDLASGRLLHRRPLAERVMQYKGTSVSVSEAQGRVLMTVGLAKELIKVRRSVSEGPAGACDDMQFVLLTCSLIIAVAAFELAICELNY